MQIKSKLTLREISAAFFYFAIIFPSFLSVGANDKKYKYFLFSLVDSENSRNFAEILRESIPDDIPLLTDFKICKLSNALAIM